MRTQHSPEVKFRHFRSILIIEKVDGEERVVEPNAGATLAYTKTDTGYAAAIAFCNPVDNYNKKYGAAKAEGLLRRFAQYDYVVDRMTEAIQDTNRYLTVETVDPTEFYRAVDNSMAEYEYFVR